jgi:hypothetical protein
MPWSFLLICLLTLLESKSSRDYISALSASRQTDTHSTQDLVKVEVVLQHSVRKLVELIDKISDVDATHGIGLRERHRLWEVLPGQVNHDPSFRCRLTLPNVPALLWVASRLQRLIKVCRELSQQEFRVAFKQGDQYAIQLGDVVSVTLNVRIARTDDSPLVSGQRARRWSWIPKRSRARHIPLVLPQ